MQISAIVANCSQVMKAISVNKTENDTDFPINNNPDDGVEDKQFIDYQSINEWKKFCHRQILNGKLDIIA